MSSTKFAIGSGQGGLQARSVTTMKTLSPTPKPSHQNWELRLHTWMLENFKRATPFIARTVQFVQREMVQVRMRARSFQCISPIDITSGSDGFARGMLELPVNNCRSCRAWWHQVPGQSGPCWISIVSIDGCPVCARSSKAVLNEGSRADQEHQPSSSKGEGTGERLPCPRSIRATFLCKSSTLFTSFMESDTAAKIHNATGCTWMSQSLDKTATEIWRAHSALQRALSSSPS